MLEQVMYLPMMEVISLSDTRTMLTYAAKICQLSHRTYHGKQREFVRKSDSGLRSVRRG